VTALRKKKKEKREGKKNFEKRREKKGTKGFYLLALNRLLENPAP